MEVKVLHQKVQKSEEIVQELANDINEIKNIIGVKPSKVHIYVAPEWKWKVFDIAKEVGKPDMGRIMGQAVKQNVHDNKKEIAGFAKKVTREITRVNYVGRIDEYSVIKESLDYLSKEAGAEVLVYDEPTYDPEGKSQNASPYKPAIYME